MSGPPEGAFSLVPILQPMLIAQLIPMFFVGIVVAETCTYFRSFLGKDRWPLVSFVSFLAACQLVWFGLSTYAFYDWTVTHWGDAAHLVKITPEALWSGLMISLITTGVQCFFARRVWLLSGREPVLPLLIVAISLATFAIGLYEIHGWYSFDLELASIDKLKKPSLALLFLSCIDDLLITFAIAFYLRRAASTPEGPFLMGPLVKRIIIRTAETNALTSLVLILGVVSNYVKPMKPYSFILQGLSPELYFLSALVSLNARNSFRRRRRRTTYEFQSAAASASAGNGHPAHGASNATGQTGKTFHIRRLRSLKKQLSGTSVTEGIQVTTDIDHAVDQNSSYEHATPSHLPHQNALSIELQPMHGLAA
ncbi:hypothetical protein BMF94_1935 [Rhodotorula taiwanensis]|uniref:DUF6534 domain-containing protein n=1 Tax=Rhodotorula taiwanensis TaxID=741276 RepID=A0A2S5BDW8_9BASI|nr:hypothetical protein BMF94_1935 [Rhodotorula taiwanensis]